MVPEGGQQSLVYLKDMLKLCLSSRSFYDDDGGVKGGSENLQVSSAMEMVLASIEVAHVRQNACCKGSNALQWSHSCR